MLTADSSDSAKSVIGEFELDWERITNKEELENSLICLLYSSGTTGAPKGMSWPLLKKNPADIGIIGVKLSHAGMVAEACLVGEGAREHWETKEKWDYRTLAHLVNNFRFPRCTTCLTISLKPIAHVAGVYLSNYSMHSLNVYPGLEGYFVIPFYMGGTTFWMPKFDFAQFLEYNRSLEITTFFSVPPIYLLCAKSPLVKDHFRSLKAAISTF
jgi:acyl-CoA synthetase (AMP-forming)/AMP-acid ligase II